MSRLPPALQPLWPLAKRMHRLAALLLGFIGRAVSPALGERGLPRRGSDSSLVTASSEPGAVRLHPGLAVPPIHREPPRGEPEAHWTFRDAMDVELPDRYVLEVDRGLVVGDYGAVVTPGRVLDYETSEYFGIDGWREHPIFLRGRLPTVEHVDGSMAVLATRGGSANYYHFVLDVLPRWGTLQETLPCAMPEAVYVPSTSRYERELIALSPFRRARVIPTAKHRAVRADRLLVPSLPNPAEVMPAWVVAWVRNQFPAAETADKPRRIYLTRGTRARTRRLECEPELLPELERRGFVVLDPGSMSVRDQIDHFAAAEVVLAPHGAALTNLVFSPPGVKVLHLFAPTYVKHCFWAILDSIPGSTYRYLVGEGRPVSREQGMKGVQDDIRVAPEQVLDSLDDMLG